MSLKYLRNIPLLYIYSIFLKRVSMPIIIIYFLFNNLNYTQIGILASVLAISRIVLEIPGGVFSDLHGKKTSLIIHAILGFLTMLFYFIGDTFIWFLFASIFYGLSGAFLSGTRNALLYDTLKELKREKEYKKYSGRILLYSHLVNAAVLLVIPFIYVINNKLPFLIGMGFFIACFISSLFMIEPPMIRDSRRAVIAYWNKFIDSSKDILSNKKLIYILLLVVLTSGIILMSGEFIQPLLLISGLDIINFGIIYAIMRSIMGFGGVLIHRLEKYFSFKILIYFGLFCLAISLLGLSIGKGVFIIIALIVSKFASGYNRVLLDDEMNKVTKSEFRTTTLSISSMMDATFTAIFIFIFGILADVISVQGMFFYMFLLFIVIMVVLLSFIQRFYK